MESRREARRDLEARGQSPTLPARSRAASPSARPSPARAAEAGARADAPPSRKCRRPSADGESRRPSCLLNGSEQAVGPVSDGVVADDELPQLGTTPAVERPQALGEALGIVPVEPQLR